MYVCVNLIAHVCHMPSRLTLAASTTMALPFAIDTESAKARWLQAGAWVERVDPRGISQTQLALVAFCLCRFSSFPMSKSNKQHLRQVGLGLSLAKNQGPPYSFLASKRGLGFVPLGEDKFWRYSTSLDVLCRPIHSRTPCLVTETQGHEFIEATPWLTTLPP